MIISKTARQFWMLRCATLYLSAWLIFPLVAWAESLPGTDSQPIRIHADMDAPQPLTILGAIELAKRNYPAIKTAVLKADAAREQAAARHLARDPREAAGSAARGSGGAGQQGGGGGSEAVFAASKREPTGVGAEFFGSRRRGHFRERRRRERSAPV